jgi:hypothetical protein
MILAYVSLGLHGYFFESGGQTVYRTARDGYVSRFESYDPINILRVDGY